MELEKTSFQEWVKERIDQVLKRISAYEILKENGIEEIPDQHTATQIACRFHGPDRRPSARYYPASSSKSDAVRCFKCNETWNAIVLNGKFKNIKFYDSLQDLEKRLGVKVSRRPDIKVSDPNQEKTGSYRSEKWDDVKELLPLLEKKLIRVKNKCSLEDYIKFCRVLDVISFDFEYHGEQNESMVKILAKTRIMMDEIYALPSMDLIDDQSFSE